MIYKTYNCNSFNVYTIKTDKFKTCHMEIMWQEKIAQDDLGEINFLTDILCENSKKYPANRDVILHLEDLYKASFYGTTSKIGQTLFSSFILDFIDPEYINEKKYLENVLKFPFEMLEEPNVINDEFDLKTFNIIKKRIEQAITSVKENPLKFSMQEAMKVMDPKSITSLSVLGSLENLEKITPASLYKRYKKMFKTAKVSIYLIGNLDMDEAVEIIRKNFHHRIISKVQTELYVCNKEKRKVDIVSQNGPFIQANLIVLANLSKLTKKERDITIHIYNYLLGNGGLTSKLYQSLREENSLCYNIASIYLKYDLLLGIHVSLENSNVKKAITLIKKCLKSMAHGEFSEEVFEDAKKNIMLSLDMNLDNDIAIVNNYIFQVLDDLPPINERKEAFKNVTKEEVMALAKKIKLNTIYTLKGGE